MNAVRITAVLLAVALTILLKPVAGGFDRPVQIVSAHDHSGALFIAEQRGRIRLLRQRGEGLRLFLDISDRVSCCDNGGLLSLVFHPDFGTNGYLFLLYVDHNGDTVVARYQRSAASAETADPSTAKILLVVPQPKDNVPNHHGGTLAFGSDGYLYVSIGDGGAFIQATNRAQELHHLLGKLLRIDVDAADPYKIPPDNPFDGVPGARGEIWSLGLRNPWRFSFDRVTGELLIGDVGQDSWEEVDLVTHAQSRGANFGWPRMEGNHCFPPGAACSPTGLTSPTLEYPRDLGCSVTGGYRYRGAKSPSLYGTYFFGDWCSGRIWAADEVDGRLSSSVVVESGLAIVSFGEDDAGELYVVDYRGAVFELTAPAFKKRSVRH